MFLELKSTTFKSITNEILVFVTPLVILKTVSQQDLQKKVFMVVSLKLPFWHDFGKKKQ